MGNVDEKAEDFTVRCSKFNFCIEVEEKKLFVPKVTLSMMSPVFDRFCNDEAYKETNEGRVVLTDQKYEEILTMLRCSVLNPSVDPVTDENLEVLLKLSDIYLIRFLQDACKQFLQHRFEVMKIGDEASYRYLKLVSRYDSQGYMEEEVDMLIRLVSNLSIQTITSSDSELSLAVGHRLFRHMHLKYRSGRHSIGEKMNPREFECQRCKQSRQCYQCEECWWHICPVCMSVFDAPDYPCSKDNHWFINQKAGVCLKCAKRACVCKV